MWWYVAAMGVSAVASWWGGQMQAAAQERQADLADTQAKIAMEQAEFSAALQIKTGREKSLFIRRQSARAEGAAVADVAGTGVELSGSPLNAIADQIHQDEHAAATAMTNSRLAAMSETARGKAAQVGYEAQAGELRAAAGVSRTVGMLDAIAKGTMAVGGYYKAMGYGDPSTTDAPYGAPERGSPYYGSFSE